MQTSRRALAAVSLLAAGRTWAHDEPEHEPPIARTALIHGIASPFAVAGYRMGEHALDELELDRGSSDMVVEHHSPASQPWLAVIDGLQAATGASLGKLNLRFQESADCYSLVKNKANGRALRFELVSGFVKAHQGLPDSKRYDAGLKVAKQKAAEVFRVR